LIQGWVPQKTDGWLMRFLCRVVGRRSLAAGFDKRRCVPSNVEIKQCALADFAANGMRWLALRLRLPLHVLASVNTRGWALFGFCTRRHLKGADVFHVRSGAGQGGAIQAARKRGMKILADHSAAHPRFMEEHLETEQERWLMGMSSPFWRAVIRDCEEADLVLVNSSFITETFIEAGFSVEKIRVVYLGVREDFYNLRGPRVGDGKVKLLFTGAFRSNKGAKDILSAVQMLKASGLDFSLDVVGDYSDARVHFLKNIRFESLPIVFHGHVPQDDLKRFLSNADIYVFPSLTEGCASSGMEAMAAGLCVIATRESGLPIVDGETGFIVPTQTPEAVVERIHWLAMNPHEINRIGTNAARFIHENCTWKKYAQSVEDVYRELLA
jgi:glycosyltransferase involved in cell wall biosynthesis